MTVKERPLSHVERPRRGEGSSVLDSLELHQRSA
jgi:hypothetical protein